MACMTGSNPSADRGPTLSAVTAGCASVHAYRTDSVFPNPLTLSWWTFPGCQDPMQPGKYQMRTTWTILGDGFWPNKTVTADSNIFEIRP